MLNLFRSSKKNILEVRYDLHYMIRIMYIIFISWSALIETFRSVRGLWRMGVYLYIYISQR